MFTPIPRSVLNKCPGVSPMRCDFSQLPTKIRFIRGNAGRWVFNDGRNVIIVTPRNVEGKTEHKVDFLFYERGLASFMHCDALRMLIGDTLLYLPCAEALFHMIKAAMFGDWDAFWDIYAAQDAKTCKGIGRGVKGFRQDEWAKVSADVMAEIARLKLACQDVFDCLLALAVACDRHCFDFKACRFTECSPKDRLYGIGIDVEKAADMLLTAEADAVFEDDFFLKDGAANVLGKAYDFAFGVFMDCGGKECLNPADLASRYEEINGKNFFESILEDGNKKAKIEDLTPMSVHETPEVKTDQDSADQDMFDQLGPVARTGSFQPVARTGSLACTAGDC